MNARNIIIRVILTLLATLLGFSYGSGLFCMYTDFFGPKYPNPDEQNTLVGYLSLFNIIAILTSIWIAHFLYNRYRRKR